MSKRYNSVVFWDGDYNVMEIGGMCLRLDTDLSRQMPSLCVGGSLPLNRIVLSNLRKSDDGNVLINPVYSVDIEDSSVPVPFAALMINKDFLSPFLRHISSRIKNMDVLRSVVP